MPADLNIRMIQISVVLKYEAKPCVQVKAHDSSTWHKWWSVSKHSNCRRWGCRRCRYCCRCRWWRRRFKQQQQRFSVSVSSTKSHLSV